MKLASVKVGVEPTDSGSSRKGARSLGYFCRQHGEQKLANLRYGLTAPQKQVLKNLVSGLTASAHCRTQSEYGGLESVIHALVKRNLISWEHKLTRLGRSVAKLYP